MNKILISYRRSDSGVMSDRIYSSLKDVYGAKQVFRDINTLRAGTDFRVEIEKALEVSRVVLVLIGPHWLTTTDDAGNRRLDNEHDPVRQEVEVALHRGLVIIPLLVEHATMPREDELPAPLKPLTFRNARRVRPDPDYTRDMQTVLQDLADYVTPPDRSRVLSVRPVMRFGRRTMSVAVSLVTVILTIFALATWFHIPYLSEFVTRWFGH